MCVSEAAKPWCLWVDEELFCHSGCCQPGEISLCISTSLLPAGLFHSRIILVMVFRIGVLPICSSELLRCRISTTFNKICHVWGVSFLLSLKREMRNLSEECSLEPVTVSMAYVYFEKLVLQGKLNKQNRKLCAGACVLLAAKISSDLRKHEVKHLIDVSAMSLVPAVVRTSSLAHRQRLKPRFSVARGCMEDQLFQPVFCLIRGLPCFIFLIH